MGILWVQDVKLKQLQAVFILILGQGIRKTERRRAKKNKKEEMISVQKNTKRDSNRRKKQVNLGQSYGENCRILNDSKLILAFFLCMQHVYFML